MNSDPGSQSIIVQIMIIVVLTAINAFFAASEIAFVSLNQNKVKEKAATGDKKALNILKLLAHSDNFLATIQVAITLSGFFASASAATSFATRLEPLLSNVPGGQQIATIVVTIILSYFTLVFGELYPKQVALQRSEAVAGFTAGTIIIVQKVTKPFVSLLSFSTSLLKKITPIDFTESEEKMTRDEFRAYLVNRQKEGTIDLTEFSMLRGVLSMDTKMAREIMVPRTDVFMIDYEDGNELNIPLLLNCTHSRVPVYEAEKDTIIGILHGKSLLKASRETSLDEIDLKTILNEALYVPETIFMDDLLYNLQRTHNHMAVLSDEYGGVVGIVTLEDLLEEIVGDIDDEYDETYNLIEKLPNNRYLVDGSTQLSKFNEYFRTTIHSNDVDSIAGYFITQHGNIPRPNEQATIEYGEYRLTAHSVTGTRLLNLYVDHLIDQEDSIENKVEE